MDTLKKYGWNSNQIKLIAIIAMTIDHVTWVFFPGCQKIWWVMGLHVIGRLTAPIMWFFYLYYPAHLFVIGCIRVMIGNGSIFP